MAEALNWSDLANTKVGSVERPPIKPAGHYVAVINGRGENGQSAKKGTLFITFPIMLTEGLNDVSESELTASGGLPFNSELTFYLTPNSIWRFTEFGKALGASDDLNVLELAEWMADSGESFVVELNHQPNERNPERPYVRVDNPMPLSVYNERQG